MEKENLIKALHSAQLLTQDIREAHTDAVDSENPFAEIAIFDLLEVATSLEQKLKRIVAAAGVSSTNSLGRTSPTTKTQPANTSKVKNSMKTFHPRP